MRGIWFVYFLRRFAKRFSFGKDVEVEPQNYLTLNSKVPPGAPKIWFGYFRKISQFCGELKKFLNFWENLENFKILWKNYKNFKIFWKVSKFSEKFENFEIFWKIAKISKFSEKFAKICKFSGKFVKMSKFSEKIAKISKFLKFFFEFFEKNSKIWGQSSVKFWEKSFPKIHKFFFKFPKKLLSEKFTWQSKSDAQYRRFSKNWS